MPSESVSSDQPAPAPFAVEGQAPGDSTDTAALLGQLRDDRLWLLRQIDTGRWPDWRLDLAALERELGQLLEQAEEQLASRR